jgi:4-amino-4-deoxy-L-arabinose transferase-like glycosyltransferase
MVTTAELHQPSPTLQTRQTAGPRLQMSTWPAVAALVLLTVLLRVGGIDRPLVGHFATKNAIYAMIARNWALGRSPFWLPMTDFLAGGQRGWHLLEIPIAAYVAGAGWAVCGGSLDVWGRAVSIVFSAASVAILFRLVRRWHSQRAAWVAALVLALSPASIIYGQSFMLESSLVFFMLATLWCAETWLATSRAGWFLCAATSLALLLCTKIFMLVILISLALLAARKIANLESGQRRQWFVGSVSLVILGAAPAVVWCVMAMWMGSPESTDSAHVYYSLYRSSGQNQIPNPLLFSEGFYWRMLGNLAGPGLTPIGFLLALVGAFTFCARRHRAWLIAMALLVALLPGKFFELQYYTLVVVPALAVLAGLGWEWLVPQLPMPRCCAAICLLIGVACSLRLAVGPAFTTPFEDRAVTEAAVAMRDLSSPNESVVTLHGAGCDLLYYCDRPGWALSTNDPRLSKRIDDCCRAGARWLVVADLPSVERSQAAALFAALPVVRYGDDYRIYDLRWHD